MIADVLVAIRSFDTQRPVRHASFLMELDLVRQGGRWLVDNVADLRPSGEETAPETTPETTAATRP